MKLINEYEYTIKKSRFIAYYYEIDNEDEAKGIIEFLKKEHKKARHIPYAYKVGSTAKKSDDKEPSNTAGSPIYNILEKNNLNNRLIAVVRYFGGIKLGAGGLIRAYSTACKEVIKKDY
ncbi:MAG: YigZ family protein [Bacilli bacterium]|nr:YigZ family protein [Bacilli bacterium]